MRSLQLVALLTLVAGCGRGSDPPPAAPAPPDPEWFRDVTAEVGIDWKLAVGPTDAYPMPQVMGAGVAVFDADGDGRLDIFVLSNAGPKAAATHQLFLQTADGKFRAAGPGCGLCVPGHGMGVAVGDCDNDGRPDVYVSEFGGGRLFRNTGNGTFRDATASAGAFVPGWGTSCAFFDYDRDGWLDLALVTYVDYDPSRRCAGGTGKLDFCHPNEFQGTPARLFRNRGAAPDGQWLGFTDVTAASGLGAKPSNGLGIVCADFDGDGWPDVFAANDYRANHLWLNNRDGTFTERGVERGLAFNAQGSRLANMGVAFADLHNHGRGDVFVTHLSEELHTLWKHDPLGAFRDTTATAGLGAPRRRGTGFGTIGIDFDHDGNVDLAVANGRVSRSRGAPPEGTRPDLPAFWHNYAERNQLFAGTGGGKFRDISGPETAFCRAAAVARGLAWGDLDGDGAIDLVTTEIEGPVRVFKNVAPKAGHWLLVRALDPALKRDALGATVRVRVGGATRAAFVLPGQSYCSSGDARAHFGLGPAAAFDEIEVTWPNGSVEAFPGGAADRALTLSRGTGRPVRP